MTNPDHAWQVRAAQLDLARQRETVPAIREFIRFAKDWGYNAVLLYLEGVVRTWSFPYRSKKQTYAADDIRQVVETATAAGLDVIPCISTMGHAEHFTRCRQLEHLKEDAENAPHMFCPSNPRVYSFLERYLAEIAGLFPSENFHIGCDEIFGLGTCRACRRRERAGETQEDLLLRHILRVRAILQPLGKRVWIWDDMLENAPISKIAQLPRDVVLCAWNYGSEMMDYDGVQGHFNNLDRRDWLKIYERLGFDVLICPWAKEVENTIAYSEIARQRRVLGGLLTNWELNTAFLPSILPATALAGALWSRPQRDPEQVLSATMRRLFPSLSMTDRVALRACLIGPLWWPAMPVQYHLRGRLTMEESRHLQCQITAERVLGSKLRRLPAGSERDMLEELHVQTRMQILAGRQRETLPRLIDRRIRRFDRPALLRQARWCVRELETLARLRAKQWKRHRPGISPDDASAHLRRRAKALRSFLLAARTTNASLRVRLFLQDSYSMPRLKIDLRGVGEWREVYNGSFKPVNLRDAQYSLQVPVRWTGRRPDQARFTVTGFGGQGISYAALDFADRSLVPISVKRQRGQVINPTAILIDDSTVCFMGEPATARTLREHRSSDASSIAIALGSSTVEKVSKAS